MEAAFIPNYADHETMFMQNAEYMSDPEGRPAYVRE